MGILEELQIKHGESFNFAKEIHKPFHGLSPVLDWCKSECVPGWRWQLVDTPSDIRDGRYIFFFDNEADFFAFCLKWG